MDRMGDEVTLKRYRREDARPPSTSPSRSTSSRWRSKSAGSRSGRSSGTAITGRSTRTGGREESPIAAVTTTTALQFDPLLTSTLKEPPSDGARRADR